MEAVEVNGYTIEPEARLRRADLAGAVLVGANLAGAYLVGANLNCANLAGADLTGASLEGTDLVGANLSHVRLRYAFMEEALLEGANLRRANLIHAKLKRADLSRASLLGANLTGADLKRTDLERAVLSGADLSGTKLGRTNLSGAISDARTIWPEGFDPQVFRGLTRHALHYEFCYKELPSWAFGSRDDAATFLGLTTMGGGAEKLCDYWNHHARSNRDLWMTPNDFDLETSSIPATEWNATVITPPPALEALEAHYIGVLFNLQVYAMQRAVDSAQHPEVRLGYFRYICLERDTLNADVTHIGEWFASGERENLGSGPAPSVEAMFELLESLAAMPTSARNE